MLVNNKLTNSRNNRQSCQVDWFTRGSEGEKTKGMKPPKESQKVIRECWTEKEASWVERNHSLIRDSTHWAILQNTFPQMLRYWNTLFRGTSLAWARPHVWPSARDKLNTGHLNAQEHPRSCLIPESGFLGHYIVPHFGAKPLCGRFL